jgi:hypothetical protein
MIVNPFRPRDWRWPTDFRTFMGWIFAATCLGNSIVFVRTLPNAIHQHYALPPLYRLSYAPAFPAAVAVISGVAWWTVWKGKHSARGWGIAASLMWALIFLRQFIIPLPPVWDKHVGALFIGSVGLVAFLWYGKEQVPKTFFEWLYERDAPRDLFNKH